MRTIIVIFTDKKVSLREASSYKKYKFLCNYYAVSVDDMIEDPRYATKMMVVGFTGETNRIQDGMKLKDIYITKVNGQEIIQPAGLVNGSLMGSDSDIDKQRNMKARNISVTLEQAIEWYNSGNVTLKTLALNAYTKNELELNYSLIESKVDQACGCFNTPMCEQKKFQVLAKLAIIAKYYNKDWKKTTCNTGYFLGNYNSGNGPIVETLSGVGVYQHNIVQYAGVIYFKNQEDAIKAAKILGDEVKELFK